MGIVEDESSVEVTKTEESLELFQGAWLGPVCYTRDFGGVHGDLSLSDDKA